jgi:hypothetical protein
MNCLTLSGINYGCNHAYSPSIKGHLRPLVDHFGIAISVQPVVLDYVRTANGKTRNNGFFQSFQLSST